VSAYLHHDVTHARCSSLPHVLTVSSSSLVQRCIITRNNFQLNFSTCNKIQKNLAPFSQLTITLLLQVRVLPIEYTNLRGGTAPGRASARVRISQAKGGRDLKQFTSRAHPPIRIFIQKSLRLHAPLTLMPAYPFTFATADDATVLRWREVRVDGA